MIARLLECAVIFGVGTHLAKRGDFTYDRISTKWGAAKQILVNGNDGNELNHQHLLALPAPQGWAVGAEYGTTPSRMMLRAGTYNGLRWDQEEAFYNRTEAQTWNGLFETTAGSTAWFRIKARTTHKVYPLESEKNVTAFMVPIAPASPGEEWHMGYMGAVRDNNDGTYDIFCEAEVPGTYVVQARIGGQRAQHCRAHDNAPTDSAGQAVCGLNDPVLTVLHGEMNAAKCSLLEPAGQDELATPTPVGTATNMKVVARDSVGNTRMGGNTTRFAGYGDGRSDVFVVTLFNDEGRSVQTSSAVQVITAVAGGNASVDGWFQLEFGGAISRQLSTSASARQVQEALMGIFGGDDTVNVMVSESKTSSGWGGVAWRTTFLSHLEKWSETPLSVVPAVGDNRTVVSIRKEASAGVYPIEYTLQHPGRYSMSITDAHGEFIAGGCRVVEATTVDNQPSPSATTSDDFYGWAAREGLNATVNTEISPAEPEPQTQMASTMTHETDPEHFDNSTSLEALPETVDLTYGGEGTLPTPFVGSADEPDAIHPGQPLSTNSGIAATRSTQETMRPAIFDAHGNCSVMGTGRFRWRRQPGPHYPWAREILDRATIADKIAVIKFSLADSPLDAPSSNQHFTESEGWEVFARRRGWSARPVPPDGYSVYKPGPIVHALSHLETVTEVQLVITDSQTERMEVAKQDTGAFVVSDLVQPPDEALGTAQQVEPPEHRITDNSGSDAASSSGRQSPDQISTRDDHVADPTDFVLPPYQSPAGLADPYGMTAPLPTEGRSRGELAARDGPETFPPRVSLILAPPEGQDHEAATSEARGSGQSVRSQSLAQEAEEGTLQEEAGIRDATPGTTGSSIGEAASSSGRQMLGRTSTRDDTVADPAVLNLPPYQRPEGLADPYGMTVPFSIGRWGTGELSTRNGPAPHPPAVSLPTQLDDQAQDQADTNGLDSDLLDRRQPSRSEGQHGETSTGLTNSATTPASEMFPPPRPPGEDEVRAAGIVPPAALLRDPSERQNHEEAPTATVESPTSYGSQTPVSEEEAEEGGDGADSRGTTPGSLLSVFPGTQSHRQESCVPWAALLPPRCEAGVSLVLLDAPSFEVSDGNDAAVASTMSASLARWALAVAALMTLMVVGVNRSALRWAYVVRTFQAVVALLRDVGTTAQSFGAVVALRVKWMVGVVRSLVRNALTTARSFGAGVVERGMRVVEILRSLRALRYMFAGTRILGAAAFSAAAWVWEETSSECPLDRLWLALVVLWMAKRDILQCLLANLWNDIWSSSQERHECELRFLPKPEPATTFLHQLAWAVALLAVYFGAMAAFVVYLEIIRPKWINWKEMQRACFEEVAAEAAKAAYRWMNLTPRTTHRRIACPPDQQGLVAAVRVLLSFPENRNLLLAYKHDQDSSAAPSWWSKWSRRWKDRQVLLELAEVLRELWYYVDELEQDWFYEAADTALNDLGRLRDAMEKLLGARALEKDGAELQLFLDVMRRTFPPEDVAFMNCGKSVASSCCNGSDSANHSAPLKIEGQLDIVSADMIWLEYIDNHLTRRSPLFRFLGQRATPRRSWTLWSRICKACRTITPRELLGLEPLRLERLPELLYIKMEGDGLRNNQLPDTVPFRAPDSDGLVYYAPAALLSSGGGGVGHIAAMRDVAAPNSRKWWSPDDFQQEVNSIESSPVFIVLRKDNARR